MNAKNWDIFCKVIDNYGDIGVCYRLAQQLAGEYGLPVRLWVDELESLTHLVPDTDPQANVQIVNGVEIRHWTPHATEKVSAAEVVIEAFACDIPDTYLQAMLMRSTPALWVNLEYLSAEDWVENCHMLTSIHPQTGLTKHFFFPGFTPRTGGLLKEADLDMQQARFVQNPAAQQQFWHACQVSLPRPDELKISLFAYENPNIPNLLQTWSEGPQAVYCALPVGKALAQAQNWSGQALQEGRLVERGMLRLAVLPFLPQERYDHLLWSCHVNFVRGEDSFIRAQWAAKPFIWDIYPQDEQAHMLKLDAFLQRYTGHLNAQTAQILSDFWHDWNSPHAVSSLPQHWRDLQNTLPDLNAHARHWAGQITQPGDLAANLVHFYQAVVE